MKNLTVGQKILSAIIGLFALLGVYTAAPLGNVADNAVMSATTTSSSWAGIKNQIKSTSGILGSVIIASTTPTSSIGSVMLLKNATSTTDISSTTIAVVGYTTSPQNFPYNMSFSRGLIVEAGTGFNGVYTITTK